MGGGRAHYAVVAVREQNDASERLLAALHREMGRLLGVPVALQRFSPCLAALTGPPTPRLAVTQERLRPADEGERLTNLARRLRAPPDPGDGWCWREDAQSVVVCNDRLGMRPLWLCAPRGACVVTTLPIAAARAAGLSLDPGAARMLVFADYIMGDRGMFARTRVLPGGTLVIADSHGQVHVERYWDPKWGVGTRRPRPEDLEHAHRLFQEGLRTYCPPGKTVALELTAGHDSRTVLAGLLLVGHPPDLAITLGGIKEADEQGGRSLAERCRIPHCVVARWPADLAQHQADAEALAVHTNCERAVWFYACDVMMSRYLSGRYDTCLHGKLGELFRGRGGIRGRYSDPDPGKEATSDAQRLIWVMMPWGWEWLQANVPDACRQVGTDLEEAAEELLATYGDVDDVWARADLVFLDQRLRRFAANPAVERERWHEYPMPLAYPPLVDFLLQFCGEHNVHAPFARSLIAKARLPALPRYRRPCASEWSPRWVWEGLRRRAARLAPQRPGTGPEVPKASRLTSVDRTVLRRAQELARSSPLACDCLNAAAQRLTTAPPDALSAFEQGLICRAASIALIEGLL